MNRMYNLYNERKEPVVVVSRNIDGQYHIKGLDDTQLAHINRTVDDIDDFKSTFNLLSFEELGQLDLAELLDF
ncbi:TPA: hypothetical protein I1566_001634 [Staphylococcus pseudintermedius]|uniref:hypothetical protein n=1 Tax=Staphylococcus pseudintermedius TaxID=283734 RepID=UPI000D7256A3|nr:hypothetical protein [Staphylococcus pseudintermedius]EGQ3124785.1 hypothetical protein [Staphylococcus pseudintermedius]EGQ3639959.1 hypothetical protein [Staphylococcus pseudintermedius]MBM0379429.1 hypothetical protein [Staphylococcus pseudintermedius]MCE5436881.1 hypothetical protein [Staphylococcus pseudintermedius]PWZ89081.1 hypothetical protein DD873_03440 [Staphylococcus pseudintermedius]